MVKPLIRNTATGVEPTFVESGPNAIELLSKGEPRPVRGYCSAWAVL